jgi:NitT/TauT family transport system ATP-binding protein
MFQRMSIVELDKLSFRYPGSDSWTVKNLSLKLEAGEFLAIVGGSGVGKSTILRLIAGLIAPDEGLVAIGRSTNPARRRRALVFQDGRLMPWRRVSGNVRLGLEGLSLSTEQADRRIVDALTLTGLIDLADRWPHQLSGGQAQRVGIARALAVEPEILLMDEPFSAVDAITRRHLQTELVRIWQSSGKAVIFVTHDIEEAAYLADRIIVLGGQPAGVVHEERIEIERSQRRASTTFLELVDRLVRSLAEAGPTNGARM